jgi:hypothetical protein
MLNAGWPALLAALSFLLRTTNLSDPLFGNVLGALQVVAALDELPQAQPTARSPVSLEGLTLGLAGGGGGGAQFAVLEALQNADYVLTMRGTALPGPGSLNTSAAAGTPTKRRV